MGYFVTPLKTQELLEKTTNFLKDRFPNSKVWVFGSYVNGDFKSYSDLDIAIDLNRPLTIREFSIIREFIETLPTLRMVDIIDLQSVTPGFRRIVEHTGQRIF